MFWNVKVWLNPVDIANIISLKTVSSKYWVTHDSNIKVHTPSAVVEFIQHTKGLHYIDLSKSNSTHALLVNTVQ